MAINMDAFIAALAAYPTLDFSKASTTTEGVGTWTSLWRAAGNPVAGATAPNLAAAVNTHRCTRATTGTVQNWVNAAGGNGNFLASAFASGTVAGSLIICDRLWAVSGISGTSVAVQSVTNPSQITARDAFGTNAGFGVEPWIEIYTAPGATAATWTLTGTDETGAGTRTWTYAHPANAETANQMAPMIPGNGAAGCGQVASFQSSLSSGTAGDIGITLLRRLCTIPLTLANATQVLDFAATTMMQIWDDSAITFLFQNTTSPTGTILGGQKIVELTP